MNPPVAGLRKGKRRKVLGKACRCCWQDLLDMFRKYKLRRDALKGT
jgi:hypothetical protein